MTIKKLINYTLILGIVLSYLTLASPPKTAKATDPPVVNPGFIGKTPTMGQGYQVAMSSDGMYAYVTTPTGLKIVNIQNPAKSLMISSVDVTYSFAVAVDPDGYVYFSSGNKIKVVNVQNPYDPYIAYTIDTPEYINDLHVSGNKLYVADYGAGLLIYDISTPSAPAFLGSVDTPGVALSVSVEGNTAVVADASSVIIADITNPYSPSLYPKTVTIPPGSKANDVYIKNGYAYIAAETIMLVIDIRNPADSQTVGTGTLSSIFCSASGVTVSGSHAYVACFSYTSPANGLEIFDITDPTHPISTIIPIPPNTAQILEVPGRSRGGIAIVGNIVCFPSGTGGMATINVTNPLNPVISDEITAIQISSPVAVSGPYLYGLSYSASGISQMHVYNINDPKYPTQVSHLNISATGDIFLDGNGHAFIVGGSFLQVVDIHDPTNPIIVTTINNLPSTANSVSISGSKLYVACSEAGLRIYNIAVPHNPSSPVTIDTPGGALAAAVSGNTAVVADGTAVIVINLSTSAIIKTLPAFTDTNLNPNVSDVAIANGYAYIATGADGLRVIDVRTPSNPSSIQFVGTPVPTTMGTPSKLEVSNNRLFASYISGVYNDNGLQVFNITTDPILPASLGSLASPGRYPKAIAVSGRTIYLADDANVAKVIDLYYDYLKVENTASVTSADHGEEITYTLTVTNPTPYRLTGLNLSNPIPPETEYRSSTGGGIQNGNQVNWDLGPIAPAEVKTVTFTVRVL